MEFVWAQLLLYSLRLTDNCKLLQCSDVRCPFCLVFQRIVAALIGVLGVDLVNISCSLLL